MAAAVFILRPRATRVVQAAKHRFKTKQSFGPSFAVLCQQARLNSPVSPDYWTRLKAANSQYYREFKAPFEVHEPALLPEFDEK